MTKYSRCSPGHGELAAGDRFRADLERHLLGMVDEDPVAAGGPEERHVLVGLVAAGAAVGIPDVHRLAGLGHRAETLAEAVDLLADPQRELLEDIAIRRPGRWPGRWSWVRCWSGSAPADRSPAASVWPRSTRAVSPPEEKVASSSVISISRDRVIGTGQGEARPGVATAGVMLDPHPDHAGQRRGKGDGGRRPVERVTAGGDHPGRRQHAERALVSVTS